MTYTFHFPITAKHSNFKVTGCRTKSTETAYQEALWHYNNALAHDGFPPVSHLPKGTTVTDENGVFVLTLE